MKLCTENINRELAEEIFSWKYKKPYDYYNVEMTEENMRYFLMDHIFL